MRNLLYIIIFVIALPVFCSCDDSDRTVLSDREVERINSIYFKVSKSDWIYSDQEDNNYYYAKIVMPEIDNDVFENGLVKVYRAYDFNEHGSNYTATQIELPYVRHHEEGSGDSLITFTETVDYDFEVRRITIYYTVSDFFYGTDERYRPESMQFRCVLVY